MDDFPSQSAGTSWKRFLGPALLMVLALGALLFPHESSGRWQRALMDLGHGPLFALLAGGIYGSLGLGAFPRWGAVWVWVLVSVFGLAAEMLQFWVGRHASWEDAWANLLGSAAGVLWLKPAVAPDRNRKVLFRGIAVVLLCMAMFSPLTILADAAVQAWQMPMLASFESRWELSRWSVQGCEIERVTDHATQGSWALQVDMGTGIYPGLAIPEVPPDWTAYRELALDVTLESPGPLPLIIKLTDQAHNQETTDRFHHSAVLKQGLNQIRIPLRDVLHAPKGRFMDLSRMQMLQLFCVKPPVPARIYVDNIRLIPDESYPGEDTADADSSRFGAD